ncbi:MAG TPA: VOC family protein [Solirubrobacteraceae bacterium]|nr:VOC family protein [Solirubrobacteraceae bacterium]
MLRRVRTSARRRVRDRQPHAAGDRRRGDRPRVPPHRFPIALHVEDIEAARAELESRGVSFTHALDSGVCRMALFEDPEGNAFLVHHRYAPRGSAP